MKLREIMMQAVEVVHPDESILTAAQKMRDRDIGFLPVCDGEKLVGVVSDRDIVARAVALGMDPNTTLGRDLMTSPVIYCYEDQDISEAAHLMHKHQIRRLVVLNRDKQLVGVVSLGDLAKNVDNEKSGQVLERVSEPVSIH